MKRRNYAGATKPQHSPDKTNRQKGKRQDQLALTNQHLLAAIGRKHERQ